MFSLLEIFYQLKSRGIDVTWENILHNVLSNEWELKAVYQQTFPVGKKNSNFFSKCFYRVLLLM